MKKALITGVLGQDGSYLAEYLIKLGYEVSGIVRTDPQLSRNFVPGVSYYYGDLKDALSLEIAIVKSQPDEIYNLAGQVFVPMSWHYPEDTFDVNVSGLARILKILDQRNMKHIRVYQATSSEIFGNTTGPINEEHKKNPESPYGVSKFAAHELVGVYRKKGFYVVSGILFNHESPRRGPEMVTRKITKAVAKWACGMTETLKLGNITSRRDWGYAGDYVKAMHKMLQLDSPEDFVIGHGESHSVEDFYLAAIEAAEITKEQASEWFQFDQSLVRANDVKDLVADASKAKKLLHWKPDTSFKMLVAMMVAADIAKLDNDERK